MSDPNTLTRLEIAEHLGISLSKFVNIINYSNIETPKPVSKRGSKLTYDRTTVLAWIESNPLSDLRWKQSIKSNAVPPDNTLVRDFLAGHYDPPARQLKARKKLIAARHAALNRRVITLLQTDEFTSSTNP